MNHHIEATADRQVQLLIACNLGAGNESRHGLPLWQHSSAS